MRSVSSQTSVIFRVLALFFLTGCPSVGPVDPVDANEQVIAQQVRLLRGTVRLNKASAIVEIDLSNSGVRDADLQSYAKLANLQILVLSKTGITDAGLRHLHNHRGLRQLFLFRSQVTDAGVATLKTAIPQCRVIY